MSIPLFYIDQNIIGLQLEGQLSLKKEDNLIWVYSKEHFSEIRRSKNSNDYLMALEGIDAKLLDLKLNKNWKIEETCKLIEYGTPTQHYEEFLANIENIKYDDNLFNPFQAWINGGGNKDSLKGISQNIVKQIISSTSSLPIKQDKINKYINTVKPKFDAMINEMISYGNDINKTRQVLGDGKGTIGNVKEEREIEEIWKVISPLINNISCDQFFGFDPIEKKGYETWPTYLGIVSCCSTMDIIGFQAEKKCRKINKIQNVRSDSVHIGMGAFCSALVSADKRLIQRAKAIYKYRGINTQLVEPTEKSKERTKY